LHAGDVELCETFCDPDELFGIAVGQGVENERIERRENRGVCADRNRKDQDGGGREAGFRVNWRRA
jgi:hypothetical protein